MAAQYLGAVNKKLAQVLVPLDQAQLGAAQNRHIAALLFQVVYRRAELCHIGTLALLDVVVNHRHDFLLVFLRRYRPVDVLRLAGQLVGFRRQRAVRRQDAQLRAARRLGVGHGQPGHIQHRYRQRLSQAVVKIMRCVAGYRQHCGTVVYQAETVLLHHGKGVILAFAHDERRAVGRRCPRRNNNVDVVLIAAGRGVVDQHLVQVTAGRRPQPAQYAQHLFLWFGLRRGTPLLIITLIVYYKACSEIMQGQGRRFSGFREIRNKKHPAFSCKVSVLHPIGASRARPLCLHCQREVAPQRRRNSYLLSTAFL